MLTFEQKVTKKKNTSYVKDLYSGQTFEYERYHYLVLDRSHDRSPWKCVNIRTGGIHGAKDFYGEVEVVELTYSLKDDK